MFRYENESETAGIMAAMLKLWEQRSKTAESERELIGLRDTEIALRYGGKGRSRAVMRSLTIRVRANARNVRRELAKRGYSVVPVDEAYFDLDAMPPDEIAARRYIVGIGASKSAGVHLVRMKRKIEDMFYAATATRSEKVIAGQFQSTVGNMLKDNKLGRLDKPEAMRYLNALYEDFTRGVQELREYEQEEKQDEPKELVG